MITVFLNKNSSNFYFNVYDLCATLCKTNCRIKPNFFNLIKFSNSPYAKAHVWILFSNIIKHRVVRGYMERNGNKLKNLQVLAVSECCLNFYMYPSAFFSSISPCCRGDTAFSGRWIWDWKSCSSQQNHHLLVSSWFRKKWVSMFRNIHS